MTEPTNWKTLANALTGLRCLLIVPIAWLILNTHFAVAMILFGIAVATDVFDGKVARLRGETSALGGLFDHATDALFVSAGLWACASIDLVNDWLPWLVGAAFIQYMLDSKALAGKQLKMSAIGRNNGIAYYVLLGTCIGAAALGWSWLQGPVVAAAWALVATTIVSMVDRLYALLST